MKLVCLPYAGATAMSYLKWKKAFPKEIELMPLDPPGRGKRVLEPLSTDLKGIVNDLADLLISQLTNTSQPYAIYGHSMGCLLVYELLHLLQKKNIRLPVDVFLSGRNPPEYPIPKYVSHLSDDEFIVEILKYGGTPDNFFENKELAKLFLPILRADYEMVEKYTYQEYDCKLPVNITYFFSDADSGITIDWINRWKKHIDGDFAIHHFNGGHFFIHDEYQRIANIISTQLKEQF